MIPAMRLFTLKQHRWKKTCVSPDDGSWAQAIAEEKWSKRRGFALVIALSLLSFIVLLSLSLISLTALETSMATNHQQTSVKH